MPGGGAQFNRGAWTFSAFLLAGAGLLRADCPASRAPRVALLAGSYVAGEATALALRHGDWWLPPSRSFHLTWGGSPSKGQDALLHATIAYQSAQVATLAWRWACVSPSAARWLGAITGIAIQLPKEIGDGLHQNGFSGTDMAWTAVGALLPALRQTSPALRLFAPKVWYWPSAEYRTRTGSLPALENDYAGQRYVLSLNPARAGGTGVWPGWLGIALGHSVPSWATVPPRHEWYVTLDFEWRGLPIAGERWRVLSALLDQIHVPAPGIRITGGRVTAGFF